jgi:hypothetical protein
MIRRAFLVWLGLLALLGLELGLVYAGFARIVPLVGLGMAATIAFGFMRLSSAPALGRFFAGAAAFWLLVLIGLGSVDYATRTDVPVARPSFQAGPN